MAIKLFNAQREPLLVEPFEDLPAALQGARTVGSRVIVARVHEDGGYTDLAYVGPDGWRGPFAKRRAIH